VPVCGGAPERRPRLRRAEACLRSGRRLPEVRLRQRLVERWGASRLQGVACRLRRVDARRHRRLARLGRISRERLMSRLPAPGSGWIRAAGSSDFRYQGKVAFVCTGIDGLKNPRVAVDAYAPGTADLIYGEGGSPADTFTLGGGSSKWVDQGGGPAHCVATL